MSIRVVALTAVLLAGAAHAAPLPVATGESALARIDRARIEGRIDPATHALLGFRLARAPLTLPAEFLPAAGEPPIRCGTELARRAFVFAKAGAFNEEQSAELAVLGGRPSMTDSIVVQNGSAVAVAIVHYNVAQVSAGLAQQIADFLSESWDAEFGTMGWRVPPPDVGLGGADPNVTLDLYLDPSEFGAVTIPIQEDTCPDTWACTASFIILEPDVPNVETYVAHELNHSSQFAYDYSDGDFIYEATATWMEDKVYDSVNDYTFFVSDFQTKPERTLSYSSYNDSYMYGGAVFLHYLSDLYDGGGTTLIRDVWDAMKPNNADWYDAVATEMSSEGFADFTDVYTEFAGVRMLTGARDDGTLEEGESMTGVSIEAVYFDYSSIESGETSNAPQGMGANYLLVVTAGADEGDALTLHVSSNEPGPWSITAVGMPAAGAATITVFPDDDDDGKVEASIPDVSQFTQIGFAVTNAANLSDGVDSQFGAGGHSVDLTTHPFSWNFGGGGGDVGCGCQIPAGRRAPSALSVITALLAVAGSIVLRRRSA